MMQSRSPRRGHHGFTLIEIMVVIVILGVLAALVVPRVLDRPDEARGVAAKSDLATIVQALKLPAVLLDYSGLHIMAQNLRTPTRFINGLGQMFEIAIERDEFPKPAWNGPPPAD